MFDLNWLSQQAHQIHDVFVGIFFGLATVLLVLGVLIEYFKMPFSTGTGLTQLVGRVFIAALLLYSYPDVTNIIADFTDALSKRIGDFNNFHLILSKMGDKVGDLSWSWTSLKDSLILVFSFVTFFLLYISVYLADAGIVYAWTILYVFSPLLLALFILPATASATQTLYRALLEVSAWKVVWSALATLLWSSALGHMNDPGSKLNFLTVIAYNLLLAISLLLTPLVVNALASKGISQAASSWLGTAAGAAIFSPGAIAKSAFTKSAITSSGILKQGLGQGLKRASGRFVTSGSSKRGVTGSQSLTAGPPMPKPPSWHKRVPVPTEPPPWMRAKLARENGGKSHITSKGK